MIDEILVVDDIEIDDSCDMRTAFLDYPEKMISLNCFLEIEWLLKNKEGRKG